MTYGEKVLVNYILSEPTLFIGQQVDIDGLFVMNNSCCYIVSSILDLEDRRNSIEINPSGLKSQLLPRVPAWGGGVYSYAHQAKISGVLSSCKGNASPLYLDNIFFLEMYMHGNTFPVIP